MAALPDLAAAQAPIEFDASLEAPEMPELRSVIETCERELTLGVDNAQAGRLHFEIARASSDATQALKHLRLAREKAPDFLPAIQAARRLMMSRGNHSAALGLFDDEIKLTGEASEKALLLYAKGCVMADLAGDADGARAAFAEAAKLAPSNAVVLKALEHAQLRAKDYRGTADALGQEANAFADDPRHRAALLTERALLLERRLRQSEEAVEQLEGALELDPYTPLALQELKRLLFSQARWRDLIAILEREAELTQDAGVRTRAYWSIARVHSERLGNRNEAIVALERAVELSARDSILLEELARLYEQGGNNAGLASTLERLAHALTRPQDKVGVLQRLAELYDRSDGDPETAMHWYEQALTIDPSFTPALRALDGLYLKLERWLKLSQMYLAEAGANVDSARRASAHARAAEILELRLDRADEAAQHYAHALALDASHEGAFKALVRLYSAAGRHRELIELYDRAVDAARTDDIAVTYLFKIAALYEDTLDDLPGAVDTYKRVLRKKPNNLGAIHAIQRAAERAGMYRELVDALDQEGKAAQGRAQMLSLAHRAAEVLAEHLGDVDAAVERLRDILKREAKHVPSLISLGRLYRAQERYEDLLGIYDAQLEVAVSGEERVALLVRMAELCDKQLGDTNRAIAYYRRAVEADPVHALARAALARLMRAAGDYNGLVKMLESELLAQSEPQNAARAALLLGEVYEVHLDSPDAATNAYKRAVDALPGYRPALDALGRVYASQGKWKELSDTLRIEAEDLTEPHMVLDALVRGAMIRAHRMGQTEEAVALLEQALSQDHESIGALLALESLYVSQDDNGKLDELLAHEASVLSDNGAKVATLVARARLLESAGDRDAQLRATCTTILSLDPANGWAVGALERLAERSDDAQLMVQVDQRYTEVATDPGVLEMHYTRLGDALRDSNPSAALAAYRAALKQKASSLAAIRGLAEVGAQLGDATTIVDALVREADWTRDASVAADLLVASARIRAGTLGDTNGAVQECERALSTFSDHEDAAKLLTTLLRRTGETDQLIDQLSQAAHAATLSERKVALWRTVAGIYAEDKHDLGAAITAAKRALETNARDVGTIHLLAGLHARDAQWKEAAQLLTRAVDIDSSALDAHLMLARIYTEHLPDAEKAHASLKRVLKDRPDDRAALQMLLHLHLEAGERNKARKISERLLEAAGDDDSIKAWALLQIGRLEMKAGDHTRAAGVLGEAVALMGLDGDAVTYYRRLVGEEVTWRDYVAALRRYLKGHAGQDSAMLAEVYLEIARAEHMQLNASQAAFDTLREGIARCGDHPVLGLEMAELLLKTGRYPEATQAFQRLVSKNPLVVDAWRGIVRVLQQQTLQAEASVAVSPLIVLGNATDVEHNLAKERSVRAGVARPGAFAASSLVSITAGQAEDEARIAAVLAAVGDGLAKAYPIAYEMYGVRKSDRIKARSGDPLRQELDRLAAVFAVEEFDLYVHAGVGGDVTVELTQPPSIMVPASVAELPEAQRVFLLSRPLAGMALGLHAALKLGAADMAMVFAAAVRRLVPDFEEGQHDSAQVAQLEQMLAPSWFGRGRVDEAVQAYYVQPVDIAEWSPSVARTVSRAAAVLAGDLDACVAALKHVGAVPAALSGVEVVKQSPLVADLLRSWVSPAAMDLRRLAGIV